MEITTFSLKENNFSMRTFFTEATCLVSPDNQNALRNSSDVLYIIKAITTVLKFFLQDVEQQLFRKLLNHTKLKKNL